LHRKRLVTYNEEKGGGGQEEDGMNYFARKPEESVEDWAARLEQVDPHLLTEADQGVYHECLDAARRQLQEQQRWQRALIAEEGAVPAAPQK
jgi:hypothetical protein